MLPLPLEAQEASYFAAEARMLILSPMSMGILYTRIGNNARGKIEERGNFKIVILKLPPLIVQIAAVLYNSPMKSQITPCPNPDSPMKPWPALAPLGKTLRLRGRGGTLFYYDTGLDAKDTGPDSKAVPASPAGRTKPVLILIHGLGDEADSWRRLIPFLDDFRVLALDLPGFGRSTAPGRVNLKRHTAAVLALLEETGPATLAGSSMGAIIAGETAAARPDLVEALIFLDGCIPLAVALDKRLVLLALPFGGKKWYRSFRTDHEGAWRSLFGYYADITGLPEADKQFLRERVIARVESPVQERAYFASLRSFIWAAAVMKERFARFVTRFPGKILIIWGAEDKVLPPEAARTIRELRPDAAFNLIPGAGHLPHQEKPAETAALFLQFFLQK
jgi:pimeloyl-ACP methyl ester carboxylesterase